LSIIFLEDKHKVLLHLSIFYEYQQFFSTPYLFLDTAARLQWPVTQISRFQQFFSKYCCLNIYRFHISNTVFYKNNCKHGRLQIEIRRGRDCMVVGFTTTYAISAYHHWSCEFESRSGEVCAMHYVIKFVSDLRQVCGFLQAHGFLHQ
jgi:hypothetical protein